MFDEIISECGSRWIKMGVELKDLKRALKVALKDLDDGEIDSSAQNPRYYEEFGNDCDRINGNFIVWAVVGTFMLHAFMNRVVKNLD